MTRKYHKSKKKTGKEQALLVFLQRTKQGKYAPVDVKSISSSRSTQEYGTIVDFDQQYYYSLS